MTVANLIATVKKYENTYSIGKEMQGVMESYSELVEGGYTKPKGYALQSFEDKHMENAKYRITVIKV